MLFKSGLMELESKVAEQSHVQKRMTHLYPLQHLSQQAARTEAVPNGLWGYWHQGQGDVRLLPGAPTEMGQYQIGLALGP